MHVPVVWRDLLDDLDRYPAQEATPVLARLVAATNPTAGRDVDLVAHTLGVAVEILRRRRPAEPEPELGLVIELALSPSGAVPPL
jgi:hypothetical protein